MDSGHDCKIKGKAALFRLSRAHFLKRPRLRSGRDGRKNALKPARGLQPLKDRQVGPGLMVTGCSKAGHKMVSPSDFLGALRKRPCPSTICDQRCKSLPQPVPIHP